MAGSDWVTCRSRCSGTATSPCPAGHGLDRPQPSGDGRVKRALVPEGPDRQDPSRRVSLEQYFADGPPQAATERDRLRLAFGGIHGRRDTRAARSRERHCIHADRANAGAAGAAAPRRKSFDLDPAAIRQIGGMSRDGRFTARRDVPLLDEPALVVVRIRACGRRLRVVLFGNPCRSSHRAARAGSRLQRRRFLLCECQGEQWMCSPGPLLRPSSQPEAGTECSGSGQCEYGDQSCACFNSQWICAGGFGGVMRTTCGSAPTTSPVSGASRGPPPTFASTSIKTCYRRSREADDTSRRARRRHCTRAWS